MKRFASLLLVSWFALQAGPSAVRAAGVTVVTHGHLANAAEWVIPMSRAITNYPRFPASSGTAASSYLVTVASGLGGFTITQSLLGGPQPTNAPSGEILINLDWGDIANDLISDSTVDIAAAVVPRFLQTNFLPGLGGRALVEFPIHLIGHSRGGSLVCEMARLLGRRGVWVDQVTLLDPHPANNDGFSDPLLPFVTDASARIYENVLFADNYWEDQNSYPYGKSVAGSYNRYLTSFDGGYSSAHSDVHLWYHATIDWSTPVSDTQASLGLEARQSWWSASESNGVHAGYVYSRRGGAGRLSDSQPAGPGTGRIVDGYNQRWHLGQAGPNNRTALTVSDPWPSLITAELAGTNRLAAGESLAVNVRYQSARPVTSNVVLRLSLDLDQNPWNGNERSLGLWPRPATTATNVAAGTFSTTMPDSGLRPGVYYVVAAIADGPRVRHLYTAEPITFRQPPRLVIAGTSAEGVRVNVFSPAGEPCAVERSTDLRTWVPVFTNTPLSSPWTFTDAVDRGVFRSYRLRLVE